MEPIEYPSAVLCILLGSVRALCADVEPFTQVVHADTVQRGQMFEGQLARADLSICDFGVPTSRQSCFDEFDVKFYIVTNDGPVF